nr:MAG TPA: hypothetical protein [Caudoviricetes sp.]DAJ57286.1 MAG TPA: hypothetical protein [Caudoviricetes sp.]
MRSSHIAQDHQASFAYKLYLYLISVFRQQL